MPIDPSIALGVKVPQIDTSGVVNALAHGRQMQMEQQRLAMQQEQHAQQMKLNDITLQQHQQAQADDKAARDLFANSPNATPEEVMSKLGPRVGGPIVTQMRNDAKAKQEADKTRAELFANIAGTMRDETSYRRGIGLALQRGLINQDQANEYSAHPWNADTQALVSQIGMQATAFKDQKELEIKEADEAHNKLMRPLQVKKLEGDVAEGQLKADTAQRQKDASDLAAAAKQGPDALAQAMARLYAQDPKRFQPFRGMTAQAKPEDILAVGETPHEQVTTGLTRERNAQTAANEAAMRKIAAGHLGVAQGQLDLARKKNEMEYGAGTTEFWVHQLQDNPDSIKEMPPALRSVVGKGFTAATGLPLPTPLSGPTQASETAARNALDGTAFIRQALQNPEIKSRLGPILGRLGNVEERVGTAVGLSPQAEALAQELRTRMRYFVFQEGKAVLGGRLPQDLMKSMEESSANVKMNENTLLGALKGAEDNAASVMDNADKQRFGGKMRSRDMRGLNLPSSKSSSGKISVTAPDGSKHDFDTQAQADAFKKLAGIK